MKKIYCSDLSDVKIWGSVKDDYNELPEGCDRIMGVSLDFLMAALRAAEVQLTYELMFEPSKYTRLLLFIYFALDQKNDPGKTLSRIIEVFRTVRTSMEAERPNLELHGNDPEQEKVLRGYVVYNYLTRTYGHIHLAFSKLIPSDLMFGAPFFTSLLFHEATHKYCQTLDVKVKNLEGEVVAPYMPFMNKTYGVLDAWEKAYPSVSDPKKKRKIIATDVANYITNEQAMVNADSFAWFYTAMIQAHDRTLPEALSISKVKDNLKHNAKAFVKEQRLVVKDHYQKLGMEESDLPMMYFLL